jgi:hypothetical protein
MVQTVWSAALMLLITTIAVSAAELDVALQTALLKLYNAYNAAVKKGDMKTALGYRDRKTRLEIEQVLKNPQAKPSLLTDLRLTVPEQYEVEHAWLDNDRQQAYIKAIATFIAPPPMRGKEGIPADGRVRQELSLEFRREGGAWKYVTLIFGANPDAITRCTDETFEGREAYDQDKNVSMGGVIRRVVFNVDHTLLIVRLLDEEHCLFLPPKQELTAAGLNTDVLKRWNTVETEVAPQKSDPRQAWIDQMRGSRN